MRQFDHNRYISHKGRCLPYKYQGRSFDGVDCWGLVYLVYKTEFNIILPTYVDPSIPDSIETASFLILNALPSSHWHSIPECQASKGDVVIFTIGKFPAHIALIISPSKMLHTQKGCETVTEYYDSTKWKRRIYGFYTYEG